MSRSFRPILALSTAALSLGAVTSALAQTPTWRDLQVVEPGVGDLGPVGISTRLLPRDLRQPSGFDRVYRVPGSSRGVNGFSPSDTGERLARVDGAITMVFPRSEYIQTKKGIRPAIPADTVYYIGRSPLLALPDAAPAHERSVYAVSTAYSGLAPTLATVPVRMGAVAADLRVRPGDEPDYREPARTLRPDDPTPAANVFTDEQFRQARIRSLLKMAAARAE